jgi:hypothetical protein
MEVVDDGERYARNIVLNSPSLSLYAESKLVVAARSGFVGER